MFAVQSYKRKITMAMFLGIEVAKARAVRENGCTYQHDIDAALCSFQAFSETCEILLALVAKLVHSSAHACQVVLDATDFRADLENFRADLEDFRMDPTDCRMDPTGLRTDPAEFFFRRQVDCLQARMEVAVYGCKASPRLLEWTQGVITTTGRTKHRNDE